MNQWKGTGSVWLHHLESLPRCIMVPHHGALSPMSHGSPLSLASARSPFPSAKVFPLSLGLSACISVQAEFSGSWRLSRLLTPGFRRQAHLPAQTPPLGARPFLSSPLAPRTPGRRLYIVVARLASAKSYLCPSGRGLSSGTDSCRTHRPCRHPYFAGLGSTPGEQLLHCESEGGWGCGAVESQKVLGTVSLRSPASSAWTPPQSFRT